MSNLVLRTVYLNSELDERLKGLAYSLKTSKNELIRQYLESAVARDVPTFTKPPTRHSGLVASRANGRLVAIETPTQVKRTIEKKITAKKVAPKKVAAKKVVKKVT